MEDETEIIAAALVSETLCEEGLIDRDQLIRRALSLAHGEAVPARARQAMSRFAIALGERKYGRLCPRSRTDRPMR